MKARQIFKKSLVVCFCLLLLICLFYFYQAGAALYFVRDRQVIDLQLKTNFFSPSQKKLRVEVVKNDLSRSQGLSGRKAMLSQTGETIDGMLFVFSNQAKQSFWMKDMRFDLDICWLNEQEFIACQRKTSHQTAQRVYHSPSPVNLVLETLPGALNEADLKAKLFFR